jgi:GxxExxY protein
MDKIALPERDRLNQITETVIGAAIQVHKALGPGLLESAYEACLAFELTDRGLSIIQQKPLPVIYREVRIDCAYRMDIVVQDCVFIEVKSVDAIQPIHKAQLLSYLKLSGYPIGLLINFNVSVLKDGIVRLAN